MGKFDTSSDVENLPIRLSLEDGWILIRASGTEPVIRLTVEGESLRTAKKIMEKGIMLVEQSAGKVK